MTSHNITSFFYCCVLCFCIKKENKNCIKNVIGPCLNFLLLLYLHFNFLLNFFLWTKFFSKLELQASISIVPQSICSIYKHTEVTKYSLHSYTGIRAKVKAFQVGTQKIPAQILQNWGGTLAPGFFSFFRVFLHVSASLVKRMWSFSLRSSKWCMLPTSSDSYK